MATTKSPHSQELVVRRGQTLVTVEETVNGEPVTRVRVVEKGNTNEDKDERLKRILALAGAWSDMDPDEVEEALYKIRHDSLPTPPIDLDDVL